MVDFNVTSDFIFAVRSKVTQVTGIFCQLQVFGFDVKV